MTYFNTRPRRLRSNKISPAFKRFFANFAKKRLLASSCLPVCQYGCLSAWNTSAPIWRIFMKFNYFFRKICQENSIFNKIGQENWFFTCIPLHIFNNISRNFYYNEKCCRQMLYRQSKLVLYSLASLPPPLRKSYRLWDNVVKYCTAGQATDGSIIWLKRFTCWIPKATDTHPEYVIIYFPRQLW